MTPQATQKEEAMAFFRRLKEHRSAPGGGRPGGRRGSISFAPLAPAARTPISSGPGNPIVFPDRLAFLKNCFADPGMVTALYLGLSMDEGGTCGSSDMVPIWDSALSKAISNVLNFHIGNPPKTYERIDGGGMRAMYWSHATEDWSFQAQEALTAVIRAKNKLSGVRGSLVYLSPTKIFLQVIEGPRDVIMNLLDRLKADARHTGMQMLKLEPAESYRFSDWMENVVVRGARRSDVAVGVDRRAPSEVLELLAALACVARPVLFHSTGVIPSPEPIEYDASDAIVP